MTAPCMQCLHGNACWTCRVAFWQWILVHAGTWDFYAWSASPQLERLSRRQGPQGLDDVSYTLQLSSHSIISANVVRWPSFSIDTKWSLIIFLLRQKNDNLALFLDYAWYELKELNQWASDSITAQIIGGRWFEWDFYLDFLKNFRENNTVPEDEQFRPQWVARAGDSEDRRRRHHNRTANLPRYLANLDNTANLPCCLWSRYVSWFIVLDSLSISHSTLLCLLCRKCEQAAPGC